MRSYCQIVAPDNVCYVTYKAAQSETRRYLHSTAGDSTTAAYDTAALTTAALNTATALTIAAAHTTAAAQIIAAALLPPNSAAGPVPNNTAAGS